MGQEPGRKPVALTDVDIVTGINTGALQSFLVSAALGADSPSRKDKALDELYGRP
jgi:hypothetical protein